MSVQQPQIVSKPHPCASPCPQAVHYPVPVVVSITGQQQAQPQQTDKITTAQPPKPAETTNVNIAALFNPMDLISSLIRDYGLNLTALSGTTKRTSTASPPSASSTTTSKIASSNETARLKKLLPFSYF